jgi:hypothetical protein
MRTSIWVVWILKRSALESIQEATDSITYPVWMDLERPLAIRLADLSIRSLSIQSQKFVGVSVNICHSVGYQTVQGV